MLYARPSILYTQNQTTKFLFGLANAGVGFLKEDWLANTIDPLPVFSFLVTITYRYLTEYAFYFYYAEEKKANEIFNLEDFRLYTGVPILVNFKSHPYKDVEVLEWYKRVLIAQRFYDSKDNKSCELLKNISAAYEVTHVIFQINHFYAKCDGLEKLYENKRYLVYRINN